jgi:hypothetical protein
MALSQANIAIDRCVDVVRKVLFHKFGKAFDDGYVNLRKTRNKVDIMVQMAQLLGVTFL